CRDGQYLKTGRGSAADTGRVRGCHRQMVAIVTRSEGHRNTPTPFAQSTPSGPRIRPASDANTVVTANTISARRAPRRVIPGCAGSLRIAPAAHSVRTKLT